MSLTSPLRLYILTGASRGLGAAMAEQLLSPDVHLVTMSRRPDKALDAKAAAARAGLEQWAVDLAQPVAIAARLEAWLEQRDGAYSSATLINNAAITGRPGSIDTSDAEDLSALLRIGLEAPMLLSSAFLRATRGWKVPRRILNISSGAGRSPLAGAAGYCAAKAGLDHFSRVTAIDESVHDDNGAKIVSLAPGVIDTDMQTEMRSSDPSRFPEVQRFIDMKTSGQLASPQQAAARVLAWLDRSDFGNKPVADVRDA